MVEPLADDLSDSDAWADHAGLVRAAARAVLGGDPEVEDVVQETWLRARLVPPRQAGAFRTWVQRVARNLALDTRVRRQRRGERERREARPEATPSVAEIAMREEARRGLVAAVLALEEPYRSAVLRRYYDDLPVRDVAARLGVPVETARTRLRRGLERLRARLDERAGGDRRRWAAPLLAWAWPSPDEAGPPTALAVSGALAAKVAAVTVAVLVVAGAVVVVRPFGASSERPAEAPSPESGDRASAATDAGTRGAPPSLAGAGGASSAPSPADPAAAPPAGPASSAGTARVVVSVLGPLKKPVEGARVRLLPKEPIGRDWRAVSDAAGLARFDDVAVPAAWIAIEAPGFAAPDVGAYEVEALKAGEQRTVEARVDAASTIEGRVVEARTGRPLARARVRLAISASDISPEAVSDAEGRFRLPDAPFATRMTLWAELEGWSRAETEVELHPTTPHREPTVLALEPAGWLVAHVRGPDGAPVARAWVLAWPEPPPEPSTETRGCGSAWGSHRRYEGTTDAGGAVRIPGLRFDVPHCVMAQGGDLARSLTADDVVATEARPEVDLVVRLRACATLRLSCRDAEGRPVVPDEIAWNGCSRCRPEVHDPEVTLEELDPGPVHVVLRARGRAPVVLDLTLAEGEAAEREVRFPEETAIEGVVVDADGAPIEGMTVHAVIGEEIRGTTVSGAQGAFRIGGLAVGDYRLSVEPRDTDADPPDPEEDATVPARAPAHGVRVVAQSPARVTLRVRMPEGVATPPELGFLLTLPEGGEIGRARPWGDGTHGWVVRPGSYRIAVGIPDHAPFEAAFDVAAGQRLDLGTAAFEPGVTVEGRVVDAPGAPLAGVHVSTDDVLSNRVTTEADGRFAFRHLPRRSVSLEASAEGFLDHRLDLDLTRTQGPLTLTLRRGGIAVATVTTAAGAPAAEVLVHVTPHGVEEPDFVTWFRTDEKGVARARMAPGRYVVEACTPSGDESYTVLARGEVVLTEGQDTSIALQLP